MSALGEWPELADLLTGAERVGPIRVMARWHGYFRPATGPGWALVGDAGHFKDPTPGQGISDALRQAEHLAKVISAGVDQDRALARWWKWRDRDAREMYWFAHQLGAPGPTPPIESEMLRRITAQPELIEGLFRVLNHDIAPSKVFTVSMALAATASLFRSGQQPRIATARQFAALAGTEARRLLMPRRRLALSPGEHSEADGDHHDWELDERNAAAEPAN